MFMNSVDKGDIGEVTISGSEVRGQFRGGNSGRFHTTAPANYPDMIKALREKGVNISVRDTSGNSWPMYLLNLSPLILFGALWFVMIRQMQRSARKKIRLTYEVVTASDVAKALEKANELGAAGWKAVSLSVSDRSSTAKSVVVLMEKA